MPDRIGAGQSIDIRDGKANIMGGRKGRRRA